MTAKKKTEKKSEKVTELMELQNIVIHMSKGQDDIEKRVTTVENKIQKVLDRMGL